MVVRNALITIKYPIPATESKRSHTIALGNNELSKFYLHSYQVIGAIAPFTPIYFQFKNREFNLTSASAQPYIPLYVTSANQAVYLPEPIEIPFNPFVEHTEIDISFFDYNYAPVTFTEIYLTFLIKA